jgi:hypothetical protein
VILRLWQEIRSPATQQSPNSLSAAERSEYLPLRSLIDSRRLHLAASRKKPPARVTERPCERGLASREAPRRATRTTDQRLGLDPVHWSAVVLRIDCRKPGTDHHLNGDAPRHILQTAVQRHAGILRGESTAAGESLRPLVACRIADWNKSRYYDVIRLMAVLTHIIPQFR